MFLIMFYCNYIFISDQNIDILTANEKNFNYMFLLVNYINLK